MNAKKSLQDYNVQPNDYVLVEGTVSYSRIGNKIDGKELEERIQRAQTNGSDGNLFQGEQNLHLPENRNSSLHHRQQVSIPAGSEAPCWKKILQRRHRW